MRKLSRRLATSREASIRRSDSRLVLGLEVEEGCEGSFFGEEGGGKELEDASGSLGKSSLSIFGCRGGQGELPSFSYGFESGWEVSVRVSVTSRAQK